MKRWICFLALVLTVAVPARAAELKVAGKSAVLMDVETGTVLFESNAHAPLAPASVTKVMTMLLVMEAVDGGQLAWEDPVTASEAAAAKGGSQIYLKVGETMTVREMLKAVAVSSANDCACALAEKIAGSESAFVERMNARAKELGMENTFFVNCTGLDDGAEAASHRTSAYDIALMSRQLLKYHPDIRQFTTIWMDTVRDGAFGLANTNKLVRFYPGATGLKTGYTSGAGFCLAASARREEMELVAVVMGAESSKARFDACRTMLDHGFAGYALVMADTSDVAPVPVKLGAAAFVQPVPGDQQGILLEKGQKAMVTTEVILEEAVTAPVSRGQRLGELRIKAGEQVLRQIPLVAAEPVARLGWKDLFVRVLKLAAMSG